MSTQMRKFLQSELQIDPAIQRRVSWSRVNKIAADLDLESLGVITVSIRDDGKPYVVDGQHRILATRRWLSSGRNTTGQTDLMVNAHVYTGLPRSQEARLFRYLNNTAALKAYDLFKVRLEEGEPDAVHLMNLLSRHGYHLSTDGNNKNAFAAVASLEWVYGGGVHDKRGCDGIGTVRDDQAVDATLELLSTAWTDEPKRTHGDIVKGAGVFLARYRHVDVARLARNMSSLTPERLLRQAQTLYLPEKAIRADTIAVVLTKQWNKSLKDHNRLPSWKVIFGDKD